ncbi:RNA polymerase I specific transcription initiation factor RRN3 [Corchorus capsularis]|uniref:RNA polymerase I specific transcription initiation factor RRN3 n=1 Tax=Corchorus capsularis TaxID=210143 RepID=A0A1R3IBY3_COCAP|nr:RNA polymerase I specific transcription initiation factor RRN3 [Corchorus capsularis]
MGLELPKYPVMEEEEVVNLELDIARRVREALSSVPSLEGSRDSYNQLVGVILHSKQLGRDELALLETTLKGLAAAVSLIDFTHHESLVSAIFSMSMWNYAPHVEDALAELIVSLAVSNGKYLDLSLGMLVNNFTPPPYFLDKLGLPFGLDRKNQVLSRVHAAFKKISEYVPLAPLRLINLVIQRMPTIYHKDRAVLIYVENMLKLESGEIGEVVGNSVLMALVDRLIDLDLEIGWDAILRDDFNKGIFEMELEDEDEIVESAEQQSGEVLSSFGNSIAELLDNLLVLTFEHLESCERAGRLAKVFETLLQSFQITVMSAYKSKFTQLCPLSSVILLMRMTAVAYLASYLSRAKFLSVFFISTMLKRLVDWCLEYCETHDGDINPNAHRVFYSGCQAIMYVLCFRMKVFVDVPRLNLLLMPPLEQILKHKLNPLKVCLPSVVEEFLRQSKTASLFTVSETFIFDGLLESELSRAFGGLERLDTFFPFDPCLLKRCDRSFDEQGDDLDEFDTAMSKMSITPKNGYCYKFGGRDSTRMPSRIRPSTSPESL